MHGSDEARLRGWPAKCTCPPLQPQEPPKAKTFKERNFSRRPLTPEPLRTLRSETKGQAGACPDRTRAIPCKVQVSHGDEDHGAEAPAENTRPRRRARCVPDRPVSLGNLRSLPGSPVTSSPANRQADPPRKPAF
jgi:hypothetical protein